MITILQTSLFDRNDKKIPLSKKAQLTVPYGTVLVLSSTFQMYDQTQFFDAFSQHYFEENIPCLIGKES